MKPLHVSNADRDPASGGFALLVALIAILGLTAMATGGFLLSRSDARTSENYVTTVRAFYMAEMGLNEYIGTRTSPPPGTWTVRFEEGSAEVRATPLGTDDAGRRIYRVLSTARYRARRGAPVERTVGTLIRTPPGPGGALSEIESSWFQRL